MHTLGCVIDSKDVRANNSTRLVGWLAGWLIGGPYCGVRTGDIGTSLFGNVWTGNGHVPELPPLDQHSVNAYVAAALQEEKVRSLLFCLFGLRSSTALYCPVVPAPWYFKR